MDQEKIKWNKKYILIVLIVICIIIAFLIFRNQESSNSLIFKGSNQYIKKTDMQKEKLTIGVVNSPQESRTYLGHDQTSQLTTRLVYEPMVYIKKDLSIEFMIADSVHFSDVGLEAKIKINKDAKFSDGSPINAKAIKDSYLSLNKSTSQYSQKELCRNIQGMEDYQLGKSEDISGITIIGEYEIAFQFKNCSILNIQGLTLPIFKTTENNKWALGTGEYAFERYSHNKSIELKKNIYKHTSKYDFEKIEIKGISSIGMKTDIDKFNLDVFQISLNSNMDNIKEAKYHNVYEVNDAYHLNYLEFNLNDPAGSNKNLRKTIYYGLNKSELKAGFDKNERLNNCQLSSLYSRQSSDSYNIDKAKKAFDTAQIDKEIEYYSLEDTVSNLRYDQISKDLKKIGIVLKKTSKKDATFKYATHQMFSPINQFEENIMKSKLEADYQKFIKNVYQKNCQNILKDIEEYCQEEYVSVPISTVSYGLVISSDIDQESVRDLMINS